MKERFMRSVWRSSLLPVALLCTTLATASVTTYSQDRASPESDLRPRPAVAGGLGVAYVNLRDVVALINASALGGTGVPDFRAAGEFFASCAIPLTTALVLSLEYAYLTTATSVSSGYGQADYSVTIQMPAALLQYVLVERGIYNLKAGLGMSYQIGRMTEKYLVVDDAFTAGGLGVLLQVEANTTLGDRLFAYLSGNFRWSTTSALKNADGLSPGPGRSGAATLGFVSLGARIGLSYQF
jgi:hypothetical protein